MAFRLNPMGIFLGNDSHPNVRSNPKPLQFRSGGRSRISRQPVSEYSASTDAVSANAGSPFSSSSLRQVMNIVVAGTSEESILYLFSSDSRIVANEEDNIAAHSGVLTKVLWNGTTNEWEQVDLIRGLPTAEEDHTVDGMVISDDEAKLYLAVGDAAIANTPSQPFSYTTESSLSGAVLEIDLLALEALPAQVDPNGGQNNLPRYYKYALEN